MKRTILIIVIFLLFILSIGCSENLTESKPELSARIEIRKWFQDSDKGVTIYFDVKNTASVIIEKCVIYFEIEVIDEPSYYCQFEATNIHPENTISYAEYYHFLNSIVEDVELIDYYLE